MKSLFNIKDNKNYNLLIVIIITFVLVEFIDEYLDYKLGTSFIHSIVQIILYVFLFLIIYYLFNRYYMEKINTLLPEELIEILYIIKDAEEKNTLLNQKKILSILKITKPTMKKRMDVLIELNYVYYEQNGNHKYLKLTSQAKQFI